MSVNTYMTTPLGSETHVEYTRVVRRGGGGGGGGKHGKQVVKGHCVAHDGVLCIDDPGTLQLLYRTKMGSLPACIR